MSTTAPVITCPRCEKKFKGKPELYGKRIRCPGCEKPFVVPSPEAKIDEQELKNVLEVEKDEEMNSGAESGPPVSTPLAPSGPVRSFLNEEEGAARYSLTDMQDQARCPNCANPMESEDAVICLHCGYNTSTRSWGKTKVTEETTIGDRVKWLLPGFIYLGIIFSQIIFCLYVCLILPDQLGDGWRFLIHESIKMWTVIINLFIMWTLGFLAYHRLILHPEPPEKVVE